MAQGVPAVNVKLGRAAAWAENLWEGRLAASPDHGIVATWRPSIAYANPNRGKEEIRSRDPGRAPLLGRRLLRAPPRRCGRAAPGHRPSGAPISCIWPCSWVLWP